MERDGSAHRTKGLLRLTMACNERCPFCNVPMEDFGGRPTPEPEVEGSLDAFAEGGERTVTISGGEPTLLRSRLLATVRSARGRGLPFVELQTNAILVDADYARALAEAGLTSAFVSLLSQDPAHHDALAGLDGAWSRTLSGIDHLLDAGVRVALNVVVARRTQALLAGYVDFVADRLPRVGSISVSTVQPHGRAATAVELLPDYAVLGPEVERARARAALHGIELLNPYCGLPACVGWQDGLAHCVEAVESRLGRSGPQGLEQAGSKSHGGPCRRCALRARCGGAWHAYWTHRQGSGLVAPLRVAPPWEPGGEGQQVVAAPGGVGGETWAQVAAAEAPAVWLHTDRLEPAQVAGLRQRGVTHLALEGRATDVLRTLGALAAAQRDHLPQDRVLPWVSVEARDLEALLPLVQRLGAAGAVGVAVRSADARGRSLVERASALDLSLELTWRSR